MERWRACGNQQRPRYGFYVDHMVDVFGSVGADVRAGLLRVAALGVAMAMLIAFLILSAESYLATYTLGCFQLSQGLFGPTEIRILLIAGSLAAAAQSVCDGVWAQGDAVRRGRRDRSAQ